MFSSLPLPRVRTAVLLLLAGSLLVACNDDTLTPPRQSNQDALFDRYVSIGNSITAGVQSGGILSQTQQAAYPVLLSQQMETPFSIPTLRSPGCPPPFVRFFNSQGAPDPQRPSGTSESTCALRNATPPLLLNNVAVPEATVTDVLTNDPSEGADPNALTQFILGDRTQIETALAANPTFASVWIGNNNVLGPALQGSANVTPPSEFESQYTAMLDRLTAAESLQGGVLMGVANVAFIPFLSPGPVYFALENSPQSPFPSNFEVAANCDTTSAGLSPLVSVPYGFTLLGQAAQNPNQTVTLDCEVPDPVLTLNEVQSIAQTVRAYNKFIEAQAENRGLAFLNPNGVFRALYTNDDGDRDPTNDLIPKFPDTDPAQPPRPFGPFFSLDGVHPSAATHRVITNQLINAINEQYDTSLETIQAPSVPTPSQ